MAYTACYINVSICAPFVIIYNMRICYATLYSLCVSDFFLFFVVVVFLLKPIPIEVTIVSVEATLSSDTCGLSSSVLFFVIVKLTYD